MINRFVVALFLHVQSFNLLRQQELFFKSIQKPLNLALTLMRTLWKQPVRRHKSMLYRFIAASILLVQSFDLLR